MTLVELFSKDDCHLCEVVKETLLRVQAQHPFELREVKIHEGDDNYEQFKERIPIVYINKGFAFQYRVSEEEFMRKLQSATSPPSAEE
jgi:glutaredoxin